MKVFRHLFFFICFVGVLEAANISSDPNVLKTWEEVDVVPMPKQIALIGSRPVVEPAKFVLVIGRDPLRQSVLGAEWINKRIVKMGGKPLPIVKEGEPVDPSLTQIVIGSIDDNSLIKKAVGDAVINVGDRNPGVRGYEIRFAPNVIYLAGADPIGVLYACVTLGELLQEQPGSAPLMQAANIRDWPDIQYLYVLGSEPPSDIMKNPESSSVRETYLAKLSDLYEGMLRRKLSMVWFKPLTWGDTAFRDMSPYARETVRLGIETGKELGIESLYYHLYPFVGLRADHPNVAPEMLEQKPKARYDTWLQSWSLDDERRAYAKELARWIAEVGFTDVGFHDTDTGGYLNPANWNNRGPFDQKRWGDDYTAATINKFQIFYDELMKVNPALRVNLTLYPYNSEIFDPSELVKSELQRTFNLNRETLDGLRKRYESFWTQLNAAFPKKNVAFAIREPWSANGEPGLRAFLSLIQGRPLFAWYGLAAAEFYCNVPSWLGTLHSGSVDDIVFTQNIYVDKGFVPILSLAMREYSWNTRAPGAASFQTRDRARTFDSAAGDNTTEAYTLVLPHLVRNYFGRALAPEITRALQANVSPFIVAGGRPDRNIIDETEVRMKMEFDRAQIAVDAMDQAWQKLAGNRNALNLDVDVVARVAYLRQVFYSTKLIAGVKEAAYRSQRLSSLNRFDDALAAIQQGSSLLEEGKGKLTELEKEGPVDISPLLNSAKSTLAKSVPMLENLLNQRKDSVLASQRSGGIPSRVLQVLAEQTSLPIVSTKEAPVIDGKVDDTMWSLAYPTEAWFLTGTEHLVADAETRFQVLSDKDYLYIAFKCWVAPGADVGLAEADREFVRIYLKRSGAGNSEMLAFAVWANGKTESTDRSLLSTLQCKVTDQKGMWQGELKIPLSALGPQSKRSECRIGFLRSYNRFGVGNVSAIVPLDSVIAGPFEAARDQLDKFPTAKWNEPAFQPIAKVRILEPKIREVTLDDRIATMVDFKIIADADCVLDPVQVEVEALDADGKVESKKELLSEPTMKYNLKPNDTFSATFIQAVAKGSVRVTLRSPQTMAEVVFPFTVPEKKAASPSTDP